MSYAVILMSFQTIYSINYDGSHLTVWLMSDHGAQLRWKGQLGG
jgi:hypothetical protein